jgi:hypothetical protein
VFIAPSPPRNARRHQQSASPAGVPDDAAQRARHLRGIALDHFCDSDRLTQFGLDTQRFTSAVLTLARPVLKQPPSPAKVSPQTGSGANHASALDVLARLAEPADGAALATALRNRDAAPLVRERTIRAAQERLDRWEMPDDRIVAALEGLIFDPTEDIDDRTRTVIALFDVPALQVTAVLLRAAHSSVLAIQVEAVLGLTHDHLIDQYGDLARDLMATWPDDDDEPDRAWLVHDALGNRGSSQVMSTPGGRSPPRTPSAAAQPAKNVAASRAHHQGVVGGCRPAAW